MATQRSWRISEPRWAGVEIDHDSGSNYKLRSTKGITDGRARETGHRYNSETPSVGALGTAFSHCEVMLKKAPWHRLEPEEGGLAPLQRGDRFGG